MYRTKAGVVMKRENLLLTILPKSDIQIGSETNTGLTS